MNKFLPADKAKTLLQTLQRQDCPMLYDEEKHRLILTAAPGPEQLYFRLPITLAYPGADFVLHNYVILLIQAGNCAVGYFEDGINLNHKVFRSYMVRKKQGKSQIKYLKTKGKSRAGSRVRLGETAEFFENINERLQAYFEEHDIHRIAISCSKTLLPYLYTSKVETPFAKNDPRLYKIPKHIHTPIYEVLLDANKFLLRGELIYEQKHEAYITDLLGSLNDLEADEDEDWNDYPEEDDDWDDEEYA